MRYDEISIRPQFEAFKSALAQEFAGLPDLAEENLQARIRGTLLMALSNKFGQVVLTTGDESEMATGYCTLYGDIRGGFAVIKDVARPACLRWHARATPMTRMARAATPSRSASLPPPSASWPDQKDQDSLPPYEVLDAIVQR